MSQHCHQFSQDDTVGDIYGFMETAKKLHNNNVKFGEFMFSVNGLGEVVLHVFYRTGEGNNEQID